MMYKNSRLERDRAIKRDIRRRKDQRRGSNAMSDLTTVQIKSLRDAANDPHLAVDEGLAPLAFAASGALLEVHQATGISLEQFGPVGDLVNYCLAMLDLPHYVPNGV